MATKQTHYPANHDNAILMLAAAEELGVDVSDVRVEQDGLTASEEVLDKAFGRNKSRAKTEKKNEED